MGLGSRAARSWQMGLLLKNEIGRRKGEAHGQAAREMGDPAAGEVVARIDEERGWTQHSWIAGVGRMSK